MKYVLITLLLVCSFNLNAQQNQPEVNVVTADIDNFWEAHDAIRKEKDSTKHLQILYKLFVDKGTPGLKAIMEARRYKPQEYVDAINNYPLMWESIRANTYLANDLSVEIADGIEKIRKIYPDLKPAKVYFTVGVFRTGGTTMDDKVLIGVETAFGDKNVNVSEFPDSLDYIKKYWATRDNPTKDFALTNVHEYIHTQQRQDLESNLLSIALLEGIAEYISTLAMELKKSPEPSIIYGKQHNNAVKAAFEKQMFSKDYGYWLWSEQENEFGTRDLGYYIGYAMAEQYYNKSKDKQAAIKEMIELDHYNEAEIEIFAEKTGYFSKPIATLKKEYEASQD